MKPKLVDLKGVADSLREQCPFIMFATINGIDEEGRLSLLANVELSVLLDRSTGFFYALEKILPVMTVLVPEAFCEVTLLNRVDVKTRFEASNSRCLFIRNGKEQTYREFVQQARLDYRILRARYRLNGILNND
jgi:hypothetical protein